MAEKIIKQDDNYRSNLMKIVLLKVALITRTWLLKLPTRELEQEGILRYQSIISGLLFDILKV